MALKAFDLNGQTIDPTGWTAEFQQYMVTYAAGVILQRCTAGVDKDDEPGKVKARKAAVDRIAQGIIPSGGGRGATLSAEDKALRDCLTAKAKRLKGETLEDHLTRVTKELAKAQGKDFDAGMVEKVKAHLIVSDLYKAKVKEYRAAGKVVKPSLGDLEL